VSAGTTVRGISHECVDYAPIDGIIKIPYKGRLKYNPEWKKEENVCCCFCGNSRSVKYLVDLLNPFGERVLTVDACNKCALYLFVDKKKGDDRVV
jgi:hypothetical protein